MPSFVHIEVITRSSRALHPLHQIIGLLALITLAFLRSCTQQEEMPSLSPSTQATLSAAFAYATEQGHPAVGTEHWLYATLAQPNAGGQLPRAVTWLEKTAGSANASWREHAMMMLGEVLDPGAAQPGAAQVSGLTESMAEVYELALKISTGPVRDGEHVLPAGVVATEFVLAAIMIHGTNTASRVLARCSNARVNSWTICDAINLDPSTLHPSRATLACELEAFGSRISPLRETRDALVALVGWSLPPSSSVRASDSPTDESNWLLPGHLIIGAQPSTADAQMLMRSGVTTFCCLIGEWTRERYREREYPAKLAAAHAAKGDGGALEAAFLHLRIRDFDVPDLPELEALVLELRRRLMSGEVIYIHCRGGHGRTGTVAVPLVASLFDSTVEAVEAYINRVTVESRASDKRAAARGIPIELPETDEQRAMAGRASERVRLVLSEGTARHRVRVQS